MKEKLLGLYRAPFSLCPASIYVFDADRNVVADFFSLGEATLLRPRGYGRFKYLPDGDALHDAMEALLLETVKDFPTDRARCVQALNDLWAKGV